MPYKRKDEALDLKEINPKACLVVFPGTADILKDEDWEKLIELDIIWRNNFKICCWTDQ